MITEETIARMKQNLEVKNEFFVLDVIKHLETQIENYKLSENESKEIIAELEAQNKTILEDNDTLGKWVDELREQVEKMKRCENCKHADTDNDNCTFCTIKQFFFCAEKDYKDWELAE